MRIVGSDQDINVVWIFVVDNDNNILEDVVTGFKFERLVGGIWVERSTLICTQKLVRCETNDCRRA